jgi:hypothetical protein
MDCQSRVLTDIISSAIKSVFSEFAQQQMYERTYYQQPMTSANIAFSYGSSQHQDFEEPYYQQPMTSANNASSYDSIQSCEESACMYSGALNYATIA